MPNPRTPTPLRILRGNPGKRALPVGEPRPLAVEPKIPSGLDPLARREWRRLAPAFVKRGILTEDDGMAFAALCTAYATLVRINRAFKECGYKVLAEKHSFLEQKSKDGRVNEVMAVEIKANPLIAQQRLALQTLRFWCQEFGTTPSARGKVQVPGGGEVDPQEDFLNG